MSSKATLLKMPALLTTASRRPNRSIAVRTIASPLSGLSTESCDAAARPPARSISSTTASATPVSAPSPCMDPPRSFTTTAAPRCANSIAYSRPRPRPAPVTIATCPVKSIIATPSLRSVHDGVDELRANVDEVAVRSAQKRVPAQQPLEIQLGVVLPGVADAAEDLNGVVANAGQSPGERFRAHRGHMPFVAITGVGSPQGVDHPAAGEFNRFEHVDAEVLDRLESTDRLAELATHLGVFDGQLQDRARGTERVGGPGDGHVIDERLDGIRRRGGQTLRGCVVEGDAKALAGLVDSGLRRDVEARRRRLDGEKT